MLVIDDKATEAKLFLMQDGLYLRPQCTAIVSHKDLTHLNESVLCLPYSSMIFGAVLGLINECFLWMCEKEVIRQKSFKNNAVWFMARVLGLLGLLNACHSAKMTHEKKTAYFLTQIIFFKVVLWYSKKIYFLIRNRSPWACRRVTVFYGST